MLGKLPDALQKFFGFVGASLTGATAIFTAMGFLAERARLVMLGLPSTSFDLQQYVETGARILAFLPIYLGTAFLLALANALNLGVGELIGTPEATGPPLPAARPDTFAAPDVSDTGVVAETLHVRTDTGLEGGAVVWFLGLVALAGGLALLWHYRARWAGDLRLGARAASARLAVKAFGARHRTLLLLLFLLVQFAASCQQARTIRVNDLLFKEAPTRVESSGRALLIVGTETLERWVRLGDYERAVQYIGWLFLLTLLTAWVLFAVLRGFNYDAARTWEKVWVVASLLLLVSQMTLLPINYGVLLSSNRFPSVCMAYAAERPEGPPTERLALVHETETGYYLYSRTRRRMWFVQQASVEGFTYYGLDDVLKPASTAPPCP